MGEKLITRSVLDAGVYGEPKQDRQPKIFRGHRLKPLHWVITGKISPERFASIAQLNVSSGDNPFKEYGIDYKEDIHGPAGVNVQKFEDNLTCIFRDFMSLDPSYPVKLVHDQPDEICSASFKGDHCIIKRPDVYIQDAHYLNAFLLCARFIKFPGSLRTEDIAVIDEIAYLNTEPIDVKAILTNAGVVRRVLQDDRILELAERQARSSLDIVNLRLWTLFDRS